MLLLKHIYGLSDEGVCERWVHDPYFQYFTGESSAARDGPRPSVRCAVLLDQAAEAASSSIMA
ncbi:hypothetical protein ABIA85_009792 [Bradyrhizobium sp. LA6.10]